MTALVREEKGSLRAGASTPPLPHLLFFRHFFPDRTFLLSRLPKGGKGGFSRCRPRLRLRLAADEAFLETQRPLLLRTKSSFRRPPFVAAFWPLMTLRRSSCAGDITIASLFLVFSEVGSRIKSVGSH